MTHTQAHIQATGIMGVDRTRHDTVGVGRLGDGVGAMGICKEVSMVEGGGGSTNTKLMVLQALLVFSQPHTRPNDSNG